MKKVIFILLIIMIALPASSAFAGIKVEPGSFTINGMPVGQDKDLGIELKIHNLSSREETFAIEVHRPSEVTQKRIKGYDEIPDVSWFYLEKNSISLKPMEVGKVKMFLKVPADEKYFNQHWLLYLSVYSKRKTLFTQVLSPSYFIETQSKAAMKTSPYGALAVLPTVLDIENINAEASFTIFNNTNEKTRYTIYPYIPFLPAVKQDINVYPGYAFVDNTADLGVSARALEIKAGGSAIVKFGFNMKKEMSKKEVILMIESDKGTSNFVRVHFNTEKTADKAGDLTKDKNLSELFVSPADYNFTEVPLGKKVRIPNPITVLNRSALKREFSLKFFTPTELGYPVSYGTQELPDKSWLTFETDKLSIEPYKSVSVFSYINIPKNKKYKNKSWIYFVEVKRGLIEGENMALACYPQFIIKTE